MTTEGRVDWGPWKAALQNVDLGKALKATKEMQERVDLLHSSDYEAFLEQMLPSMKALLERLPPNPSTTAPEHLLRHSILELVSRMPNNDVLRKYASLCMTLALRVLKSDYEENALLATRFIFDLHKNYRTLHDNVQEYLDFCHTCYRAMPQAVQRIGASSIDAASPTIAVGASTASKKPAAPTKVTTPAGSTKTIPTTTTTVVAVAKPAATPGAKPAPKITAKSTPSSATPKAQTPKSSTISTTSSQVTTPTAAPEVNISSEPPKIKPSVAAPTSTAVAPQQLSSRSSFRVITECPLTVMLLFQLYPKFQKTNIPTLIQLMMEFLGLKTTSRASRRRTRELVAAQVKTLSFLTYVLRGFSKDMKHYEERLASHVIALLQSCPREAWATRKELLVATRHILATDFRRSFLKHMDILLLDDRLLLGGGRGSAAYHPSEATSLKPLAYSTLADLVHHVRPLLNRNQLGRVVSMFSRVLQDRMLPVTLQITAVRLLLNLVDTIFQQDDKDLLGRILHALVTKLGSLRPTVKAQVEKMKATSDAKKEEMKVSTEKGADDSTATVEKSNLNKTEEPAQKINRNPSQMDVDSTSDDKKEAGQKRKLDELTMSEETPEEVDLAGKSPLIEEKEVCQSTIDPKIWSWNEKVPADEQLRDVQSLVRSIVVGLKTVIWRANSFRASVSEGEDPSAKRLISPWEQNLIDQYVEFAIPCVEIFSNSPQYRDVLSYFAASLTVLDSFNFRKLMDGRMPLLVDAIVKDQQFMVVIRQILGSRASYDFCSVVLLYVMDRMSDLTTVYHQDFCFVKEPRKNWDLSELERARKSTKEFIVALPPDTPERRKSRTARASVTLELMERVLKSLSTDRENEAALRPHLRRLVGTVLRSSMETYCKGWPDNYCILLRCIFRSISAGKFEESYKVLLPMIPTILNGLYRIFQATEDESLRNTMIELCLTIPARLSSLLPHMSLLLRMIIPSLRCRQGELVNLGLRTLEFWIDNLNPEFLYPILSRQTSVLSDLMTALSEHLRPAPYPYGLLTLRLLGKLGGKNRRFLREPFALAGPFDSSQKRRLDALGLDCTWVGEDQSPHGQSGASGKHDKDVPGLRIPLRIDRAVRMLKLLSAPTVKPGRADKISNDDPKEIEDDEKIVKVSCKDLCKLWGSEIDKLDLEAYCQETVNETRSSQAKAALRIVSYALEGVADFPAHESDLSLEIHAPKTTDDKSASSCRGSLASTSTILEAKDEILRLICEGLLYGTLIKATSEEAWGLFQSYIALILSTLVSNSGFIKRTDANGCRKFEGERRESKEGDGQHHSVEEGATARVEPAPLGKHPFGCFDLVGPFDGKANPLVVNEAIAKFLCESNEEGKAIGKRVVLFLVQLDVADGTGKRHSGLDVYFEHLLSVLCEKCSCSPWNLVDGLYSGLSLLIEGLGQKWAFRFELELVMVALMAVKKVPREIPYAGVRGFQMLTSLLTTLYGDPSHWKDKAQVIDDVSQNADVVQPHAKKTSSAEKDTIGPCKAVQAILIGELASTKHLVRFSARYALKHQVFDTVPPDQRRKVFASHLPTIKRNVFTRSLRLLPLPEQVGVIEALSVVIDCIPGLVPINDPQLLGFLSEFLKMSSVVDREMSDSNLVGFFANKCGYATSTQERGDVNGSKNARDTFNTAIFLRQECVTKIGVNSKGGGSFVMIPEELPIGIQLRVSALRLFRAVIRRHSDDFFDAQPTTPIGNIRPHVISLLFRSLVSSPPMAVLAAHDALRDVLSLSVVTKESNESADRPKSHSRLPKELLQTCIRPVLLNLREYTRLTVPLLRGLARLLSLLSTWFNKTLGEKVLEHIQKWTDPDRIMSKHIWEPGEEPLVAGAILDLFPLLPHASNFVEPLVKTTIKLEAVLHHYKGCNVHSPYRSALARYLNKHCQHTVSFFFQRLQNPLYSDLFQELLLHEDSVPLRNHLSGKQCSINLLNVCFERPLAIIRSDKSSANKAPGSPSPNSNEVLVIHGIGAESSLLLKQKEVKIRQEAEKKQKSLVALQKEVARMKEILQARLSSSGISDESIEEARRNHKQKQAAYERIQKDLKDSKQRHAAITSQLKASEPTSSSQRRMTHEALELQHQGLKIAETLSRFDEGYLIEHSDVVRAFRWLWRSKGRHIRLQHEYRVSVRFHEESKLLAHFLVKYAASNPADVDVLFELLRIFLQHATSDFSFVRIFLEKTLSSVLNRDQKAQVMQRFFTLIGGEGPDETKVLSIQLIVFPVLRSTLSKMPIESTKDSKDSKVIEVFGEESVSRFINQVLVKDGKPMIWGDRVRIELLRLSTLLLEMIPFRVQKHKESLQTFALSLLKTEDITCKNWAYVNLCKLISVFESAGELVLQTYTSLLRLFQHEGKDLCRLAIDFLVPRLRDLLQDSEFERAIDTTTRMMYEEANSMPHMAHLFTIVVAHPEVFQSHRDRFIRHIVNTLNRLGLPPSCPIENRTLSLSLTELVLDWSQAKERPVSVNSPKRQKATGDGAAVLEPALVETMANFLVRMKILLTDAKIEGDPRCLDEKASCLLRLVLYRWDNCNVRPIYFEKVVSMCRGESSVRRSGIDEEKGPSEILPTSRRSPSRNSRPGKPNSSQAQSKEETRTVNTATLSACLDVFIIMVENSSSQSFLSQNSVVVREILEACFRRASPSGGSSLRKKLKQFLVPALKLKSLLEGSVVGRIKAILEAWILESCCSSEFSNDNRDSAVDKDRLEMAFFALTVIESVAGDVTLFVESFTAALLSLCDVLLKRHSEEPQTNQRQPSLSHRRENVVKHATPTTEVLDSSTAQHDDRQESKLAPIDVATRWTSNTENEVATTSLVIALRLLGRSRVALTFTAERQRWIHILSSVLHRPRNIKVTLSALQVVGDLMLKGIASGPLTRKEKDGFMAQVSALDNNSLSPVLGQPLSDMVGHFTRKLMNVAPLGQLHKITTPETIDLLPRLILAGMMNTNDSLRFDLTNMFWQLHGTEKSKPGDSPGPSVILWRLLHSDFEGQCNRMWPVLMADLLVSQLRPEMGTNLSNSILPPVMPKDTKDPDSGGDVKKLTQALKSLRSAGRREARLCETLDAVRTLAHGDGIVAQTLLDVTMASAWSRATQIGVVGNMIPALEKLLARPYHVQSIREVSWGSSRRAPLLSAPRSILQAVSCLSPLPFIDCNLLVSLATGYGLWHEVLDMLNKQEPLLRSNGKHSELLDEVQFATSHCLRGLGERTLHLGYVSQLDLTNDTKWALSLDIQGMVKDSIGAYERLVDMTEANEIQSATNFEMKMWENQWLLLQREVSQIKVVQDFATATKHYDLMLECSWKTQDWEKVKNLCREPEVVAAIENGDPLLKTSEIFLAITEGRLTDVENLHAQTSQLALNQWQLLPSMSASSPRHASLLHFFHRLVELRESGQIMVEATNHSNRKTFPDLKNLLSAWRHRLPNEHDNISDWEDIMEWRSHMFAAITSNFNWSEPSTLASLHDRPWTAIKMAETARNHGLRDVALSFLNKLTDCAMDVSDAFSKLREQILAYDNPVSEVERKCGLNLINTTNLAFFDNSQKSELFRLKATFLYGLGGRSKANQAYCHAVQVCPTFAKAWVSWGSLCTSLGRIAEKQLEHTKPDPGKPDQSTSSTKKVAQYMAQALGCYLEAIQCDPNNSSRLHLAKCLGMLTKDGSTPGVLCQTLEIRGSSLPSWVWLPWCPQLLTSLHRNEGNAVKTILSGLVKTYPQALYFPLRAFYLERRDVERSRGTANGHMPSVAHSEELMSALRRAHASLWSSLESILEELIVRFRPSYEEELLATTSALVDRAESHASNYGKGTKEDEDAMVTSVSKTLGRVSAKFFRDIPPDLPGTKRDDRTKKTAEFTRKYKALFEEDFLSKPAEGEKRRLSYYLTKLRKWKGLLHSQVSSTPTVIPLVEASTSLAMFTRQPPDLWPMSCDPRASSSTNERSSDGEPQSATSSAISALTAATNAAITVATAAALEGVGGDYGGGSSAIEIPGHYVPNTTDPLDLKPSPELHPKLVRFEACIQVIRRNEQLVRRIGMIGSDGKTYRFLLQFAIPYWARTDERTAQLHYIIDKLLRKDIRCATNQLSIQPTPVIPIAQRLRMTAEYPGRVSLDEVFRQECEKNLGRFDDVTQFFQGEVARQLSETSLDKLSQEEKTAKELQVKVEVLKSISEEKVDSTMLLRFLRSRLIDGETLFNFRRVFAGQLAANSLLQYAFCVVERNPSRMVFREGTGQVLAPEFRFSYNNQGFMDNQKVPFRFTPLIREALSPLFIEGRFIPSMATIAGAIKRNLEDLDPILRLLLRDDIMAWYTSKSMAKSDSRTQELEQQLFDRVSKNVSQIQIRMVECAPRSLASRKANTTNNREGDSKRTPTDPVNRKVRSLIEQASSEERLCMMLPTYQPWL